MWYNCCEILNFLLFNNEGGVDMEKILNIAKKVWKSHWFEWINKCMGQ